MKATQRVHGSHEGDEHKKSEDARAYLSILGVVLSLWKKRKKGKKRSLAIPKSLRVQANHFVKKHGEVMCSKCTRILQTGKGFTKHACAAKEGGEPVTPPPPKMLCKGRRSTSKAKVTPGD